MIKEDLKKKADPVCWDEFRIYSSAMDLFLAFRKIRGSNNVNMDISIFCNILQNKLIDSYGEEITNNG